MSSTARFTASEALRRLQPSGGERFATIFEHGTLAVEIYAPRGEDPQQPHTRDELYVVISGSGTFVSGEERTLFEAHDVLFAPAGMPHRFVNFTGDFAVWVFFYGPEGGERSS